MVSLNKCNLAKANGFTLIELLIVISIIGILTAVALPAYQDSVRKGNRVDAQQTLLGQVAILERIYTRMGGYPDSHAIVASEYYSFTYAASTAAGKTLGELNDSATFLLTANPKSSQSSDVCGSLTVNHQGTSGANVSGTKVADCWN